MEQGGHALRCHDNGSQSGEKGGCDTHGRTRKFKEGCEGDCTAAGTIALKCFTPQKTVSAIACASSTSSASSVAGGARSASSRIIPQPITATNNATAAKQSRW